MHMILKALHEATVALVTYAVTKYLRLVSVLVATLWENPRLDLT